MEDLLNYIYFSMKIPLFFRVILVFLAALVLVLLLNLIISGLSELIMNVFKRKFLYLISSVVGGIVGITGLIAALFVGVVLLCLILSKCTGG